jgi:hypothetical protein
LDTSVSFLECNCQMITDLDYNIVFGTPKMSISFIALFKMF